MSLTGLNIIEEINISNTGYFHFKVTDQRNEHTGHGTSSDRNVTLLKASHEFAERKVFKLFEGTDSNKCVGRTSSGFACHFSFKEASVAAENELFERHVLLSHWFEKVRPKWLTIEELPESAPTLNMLPIVSLIRLRFELKFGILGLINEKIVVVGAIWFQDGRTGPAIATACDNSFVDGVNKVLSDLIRVADMLLSRKVHNQPLYIEIKEDQIIRPQDHLEFYLNPNSWNGNEWFFESSDEIKSYETTATVFQELPSCSDLSWSHVVVKAFNPELQHLFFGITTPSKIASNPIGAFLNLKPHPLA